MSRSRKPRSRRLPRVLTALGSLALLLASAGGAFLWLLHGQASLEGYRPPITGQPRGPGRPTAALAPQVVLVIVDGLRYDAVAQMPTLSLLQRQGASARAIGRPPTYTQPALTTLVTGAWPELNGASLLNVPESLLGPIPADHIFAAARRANLTTALAGQAGWDKMVPRELLDEHYFVAGFDATADQDVADTAIRFLRNFHPNLTLICFASVDLVAHQAGATGRAYHEAALQVDDHLRDIVEGIDLSHAVLVVAADHGQIDRGGHGGNDLAVVTTPFVMVGEAVKPGDYGAIAQTDIAPTIAAILGAPMPRLSQGTVRFEMLRYDEVKAAQTQLEAALQRQEYADLYLSSIGQKPLSETAEGDVAVAVSSLEVSNYESAYRLAGIAIDRIDRELAQGRENRIERERSLRLPLAAAAVAFPLAFLVLRGGRRGAWLFFSALVTLLVYNGLFWRQGQPYSFSILVDPPTLLSQTAGRVALASVCGALLVLWRLVRDHEGSALEIIQTSLGYSLLVVYLLAVQGAIIYWLIGLRFTWYVPDMGVVFWQLATLLQALFFIAAGLALPILLILAGLLYQAAGRAGQRMRRAPAGGR